MGKPIEDYGYGTVGPGWKLLLSELDDFMENRLEDARRHGGGKVLEQYRDKQCKSNATIEILQVKEKFGTLRVYWKGTGLGDRLWNQVAGAIALAEAMSSRVCEKCGSQDGVETRARDSQKFGRVLTLCAGHHEERENLPSGEWFHIGENQKTV